MAAQLVCSVVVLENSKRIHESHTTEKGRKGSRYREPCPDATNRLVYLTFCVHELIIIICTDLCSLSLEPLEAAEAWI